jgi:hypothetical protein
MLFDGHTDPTPCGHLCGRGPTLDGITKANLLKRIGRGEWIEPRPSVPEPWDTLLLQGFALPG